MLLAEFFDTAGGIDQTLFPGKEGVTARADIDMQFLGGGKGLECISAGAENLGFVNCRVNVGAHFCSFLSDCS